MYLLVHLIICVALYESVVRIGQKIYGVHPDRVNEFRSAVTVGALGGIITYAFAPVLTGMLVAVG